MNFKILILLLALSLLIIMPSISFAFHSYSDGGWDYYGSGRDHPYSQYIDRRNYIGYADYPYLDPEYIDASSYTLTATAVPVPISVSPVVSAPALNEFTVNIPNKHGGYSTVILKRSGSGFIGPQGEYYPEFPKVFQLEMMYGK